MPNLTNDLQPVDLTTVARVKAHPGSGGVTDSSEDALLAQMITSVSARFGRETNLHGLEVERTEVYAVRQFAKLLTLDAKPVSAIASLKYAGDDDFTNVADTSTTLYVLNKREGTVHLQFETGIGPRGYIQVQYTGGWGEDSADVIATHPELAEKCDLQVSYMLARRHSLGGNVETNAGQNAVYTGQYQLLDEVLAHLLFIGRGGGF